MGKSGDMRVQPFHGETGRQPELSASQSLVPPGPKPMGTQTKPAPPCPLPVGTALEPLTILSSSLQTSANIFSSVPASRFVSPGAWNFFSPLLLFKWINKNPVGRR